jgi:hypothetical protein
MKRWVVLGGALLVLSCALFLCEASDEQDAEKAGVPEPRSAAPQGPPPGAARLELEPMAEAPANSAVRVNEPIAPSAPPAPPPMPPSSHFEAMRQAFESESRDDAWAGKEEARIPQLLIEAGFASDAFDRNATCRRSVCRFSLRLTEQEQDQFALMKLAAAVQTDKGLSLAYGAPEAAGDKTRVIIYVPREGTSRDDLPAQ